MTTFLKSGGGILVQLETIPKAQQQEECILSHQKF